MIKYKVERIYKLNVKIETICEPIFFQIEHSEKEFTDSTIVDYLINKTLSVFYYKKSGEIFFYEKIDCGKVIPFMIIDGLNFDKSILELLGNGRSNESKVIIRKALEYVLDV